MTSWWWLGRLCLVIGCMFQQSLKADLQPTVVEQGLAGIRIGERVSAAKQLYPGLRWSLGVWRTSIGRSCRLEVVAGKATDLQARINVITVKRNQPNDQGENVECDSVRTGKGLPFGGDLKEIRRLYPGLALMEDGKEPALYREDNDQECLSGRTSILRSMFLYWSNQVQKTQTISIDASRLGCQEYRDTERGERSKR